MKGGDRHQVLGVIQESGAYSAQCRRECSAFQLSWASFGLDFSMIVLCALVKQ